MWSQTEYHCSKKQKNERKVVCGTAHKDTHQLQWSGSIECPPTVRMLSDKPLWHLAHGNNAKVKQCEIMSPLWDSAEKIFSDSMSIHTIFPHTQKQCQTTMGLCQTQAYHMSLPSPPHTPITWDILQCLSHTLQIFWVWNSYWIAMFFNAHLPLSHDPLVKRCDVIFPSKTVPNNRWEHHPLFQISWKNAIWWYLYHFPSETQPNNCGNTPLTHISWKNAIWWYPYHVPIRNTAKQLWEHPCHKSPEKMLSDDTHIIFPSKTVPNNCGNTPLS